VSGCEIFDSYDQRRGKIANADNGNMNFVGATPSSYDPGLSLAEAPRQQSLPEMNRRVSGVLTEYTHRDGPAFILHKETGYCPNLSWH
jgi:hypothetical protein